jgi:uncharacterized protein (TIGR02147 family)
MASIYAYTDYRKYLADSYLEFKRTRPSGFTHRRIGQKGNFDPGLFSKVIQGQRNISRKLIPGFCQAFGIEGDEARFFERLVVFNQTRNSVQQLLLSAELDSIRKSRGYYLHRPDENFLTESALCQIST